MSPYFFKRILMRPFAALASLLLVGSLAILLSSLISHRQTQQKKLVDIQQNADILCVVTDRRGQNSTSLRMNYGAISMVTDASIHALPDLIRDVIIVKEFFISSVETSDAKAYGITDFSCSELTDPKMGARVNIDIDDFFDTDEYVCIVSKKIYNLLDEGKVISFMVTDPYIDKRFLSDRGIGRIDFKVCGYYLGEESTVFIPFKTAMRICNDISYAMSCDEISFFAADNLKLDELSNAASEYFGSVDPYASEFSTPRYALTIHDEAYQTTVAAIRQNIARSTYLMPVAAIFALISGFIAGFLSTRGERTNYALMRSVGMTKKQLFTSVLFEQLLPPFVISILAGVFSGYVFAAASAFILYAFGCIAATVRAVRVAPTQLLREQE